MKKFLAFLLTLTMVLSASAVLVSAFEIETEPALGFLSERFKAENNYKYADDEVVTAIVVASGKPAADYGANGSKAAISRTAKLNKQHSNIFKAMQKADVEYETLFDYTTLLNGFAVEVEYGQLEKIAGLNDVEAVYIANEYRVPEDEIDTIGSGFAMGSTQANASGYTGAGMVIAILDTGLNYAHEAFMNYGITEDTLDMETVYELMESGVISDGDYYGEKVPFGYDYADGDWDVWDTFGHGTHVAGIAAGLTLDWYDDTPTFMGAAPAAQIVCMKVFADGEGTTNTAIYYKALEDAYALDVDVINMSLGAPCGFTYDSELDEEVFGNIYQELDDAGIILCAAAGNEFSQGYNSLNAFTQNTGMEAVTADYADYGVIGSPATYLGNLSVASVENPYYMGRPLLIGGNYYGYYENDPDAPFFDYMSGTYYEYVMIPNGGYDAETDYGVNVDSRIAVVDVYDESMIYDQAYNAYENDAIALIAVCERPYDTVMLWYGQRMPVPVVFVTQEAGAALAENATMSVGELYAESERQLVVNPDGGRMSDFSNWGVTSDLQFGPMVSGIGGSVYSSYIDGPDSYITMDGTSMATPNVAGNMAIVLQYLKAQYPELSKPELAAMAEELVESTATVIFGEYGAYSPRKQGAGLVNSFDAINAEAYITDPIESLLDDADRTGIITVSASIRNLSDVDVSYEAEYTLVSDIVADGMAMAGVPGYYNLLMSAALEEGEDFVVAGDVLVTVPAGQTVDVTLTFALTDGAKDFLDEYFANGAFVDGFINFVGQDGEVAIHKSFISFYGDWTAAPMLETANTVDMLEALLAYMDEGMDEYEATELVMSELGMNVGYNIIASYNVAEDTVIDLLGLNVFAYEPAFSRDYMMISNDPEALITGFMAQPALLRNAEHVIMAIVDNETGDVYYIDDTPYVSKNIFYEGTWYANSMFVWDGTDAYGNPVEDGTVVNAEFYIYLDYENVPEITGDTYDWFYSNLAITGQECDWTFSVTVDNVKPEIVGGIQVDDESIFAEFADDDYLAYVTVTDIVSGYSVYGEYFADTEPGVSHTVSFGLDEIYPGTYEVAAADMAGNAYYEYVYIDEEYDIHIFDPETGFCVDGDGLWCSEDGIVAEPVVDDELEVVDVYFTGMSVSGGEMVTVFDEYGNLIDVIVTDMTLSINYPMEYAAGLAADLGYGVSLWFKDAMTFDFDADAAALMNETGNAAFMAKINADIRTGEVSMFVDPCGLNLSECPATVWIYGSFDADESEYFRIYAFDEEGTISKVEYDYDALLEVLSFELTEATEFRFATVDNAVVIAEQFAAAAEKYAEQAYNYAGDAEKFADNAAASENAAKQAEGNANAAQIAAEAAADAAKAALDNALATKADVDDVLTRANSAKDAAQASADAAKASADAAKASADAAKASADAAKAEADKAKADAEAAAQAKADAEAAKAVAEEAKTAAEAAKAEAAAEKAAAEAAKAAAEAAKTAADAAKAGADAAKADAEAAKTAAEDAKATAESKATEVGDVKAELETRLDEAESLAEEAKTAVENSGCKSTVAAGAVFAVLGLAFVAIRKKKD